MPKSRLFRSLLDTINDDDVRAVGSALGIGQQPEFPQTVQPANIDGKGVPQIAFPDSQADQTNGSKLFSGNYAQMPGAVSTMPAAQNDVPPVQNNAQTATRPRLFSDPPVTQRASQTNTNVPSDYTAPTTDNQGNPLAIRSRLFTPHTSDELQKAYIENQTKPYEQQHSLAKRLGSGLWKGIQAWAENGGQGGLGGLIGAAATGGVGSTVSPGFEANLRRNGEGQKLLRQLSQQQQLDIMQSQRTKAEAEAQGKILGNAKTVNDINSKKAETDLNQRKFQNDIGNENYKRLNEGQQKVIDMWKAEPDFDPADPNNKPLMDMADKAGITLVPKKRNDQFNLQIAPNGTPIIVNARTGEYKEGTGNYSKPPTLGANDFRDEEFGIKSDKDISDEAAAKVGKLPTDRKIRPEVVGALLNAEDVPGSGDYTYRNPNGSLNEAKIVEDIGRGVGPLQHLDDLYENLPSNYEQNLASARLQAKSSQDDLRKEVARFRSNVSTYKPIANARNASRDDVVTLFKQIMIQPPKKRADLSNKFYSDTLPKIRIQ